MKMHTEAMQDAEAEMRRLAQHTDAYARDAAEVAGKLALLLKLDDLQGAQLDKLRDETLFEATLVRRRYQKMMRAAMAAWPTGAFDAVGR